MTETDPKHNVPEQPGPEEHPGEDGQLVSADRTRLKSRLPDRERADEQFRRIGDDSVNDGPAEEDISVPNDDERV